jgi:hypothetical protein
MELFPYIPSQFVCNNNNNTKSSDFCNLNLYLPSLLYLLMVCKSFWVEFFVSLRYRIMSSANRDILTVSLPIYIPFISSSCLTALARNSMTVLNQSGDSAHTCLVPDFRGNGFSFCPLSMMLAVGLIYSLYNVEVHSFYS